MQSTETGEKLHSIAPLCFAVQSLFGLLAASIVFNEGRLNGANAAG